MTLAQQLMLLEGLGKGSEGVDPRSGRSTVTFDNLEDALAYQASRRAGRG